MNDRNLKDLLKGYANDGWGACGKVRVPTRAAARFHARRMTAKDGQPVDAYRCGTCSAPGAPVWHVGRRRKSARARERGAP